MKELFFVTPIGEESSSERARANNVMEFVLKSSLSSYEITRADQIENPGSINTDIIQRLHKADLVIADLTGFNPNVMYEVGVRHSFNLPIVQLAQKGQKLPFDLATERTIFFDINDLQSVEEGKKRIVASVRSLEKGEKYTGPVQRALNIAAVVSDQSDVASAIESLSDKLEVIGENMWAGYSNSSYGEVDDQIRHIFNLVAGINVYEAEKMIDYLRKKVRESAG